MKEKGITLVALAITIIILIILAAVTIKMVTNSEIISRASEGAEKYARAQDEEMKEFDKISDMLDKEAGSQVTINKQELQEVIKEQTLNIYHPIGSIYISTEEINPEELFGGKWESYGEGRTLIGVGAGYEEGETGGNKTAKLTVENLPSHNHYIPSLTGTAARVTISGDFEARGWKDSYSSGVFSRSYGVINATEVNGNDIGRQRVHMDASHSHTVTTNEGATGIIGENKELNIQNPYIATYMWKRIA